MTTNTEGYAGLNTAKSDELNSGNPGKNIELQFSANADI